MFSTASLLCHHSLLGLSRESCGRSTDGDLVDLPDLADETLLLRDLPGRSTEVDRPDLRTEGLFVNTAMPMSVLVFEEELEAREI